MKNGKILLVNIYIFVKILIIRKQTVYFFVGIMRKIIYTVSVDGGECFRHCVASQKKYAEKIDVDFYVRKEWRNWNEDLKTDCEKRHIVKLLESYDKVLYLDADVFIRDNAPDIFEKYRLKTLVMYNEVLYNGVQMDDHIDYCAKTYNIEWLKTHGHYDWYNAGVMLCGRGSEKAFDYNPKNFFKFPNMPMIYDMPYMHYNIFKNNIYVDLLDEEFNTMVYFKDDGYFLHFANVLDRDERIKKYI